MKLSIEEKVKAYDKVREKIAIRFGSNVAKEIFSKYEESENERIRESLLEYLHTLPNHYTHGGVCVLEWIAWLEKQGEQKPIKHNNDATIDSNLNDYCCKVYSALHKENGGNLSFARLQHLAMDIYKWCKEQQKLVEWTELTWKDIVELEGIINNVHYDFSAGIGQESFGKEVLERFRSTKGIEYLDEAEQKYWREEKQKPAWSEEDYFELIQDANYCGAGNLNKKRMIEDFRKYMEGK